MTKFEGKALSVKTVTGEFFLSAVFELDFVSLCKNAETNDSKKAFLAKIERFLTEVVS